MNCRHIHEETDSFDFEKLSSNLWYICIIITANGVYRSENNLKSVKKYYKHIINNNKS